MKNKILVVEDEEKILRFIKANLVASGYKVYVAKDGQSALDLYEKYLPEIILLDVKLPKLDGFEVLRRIRGFSDVPVILVTVKDSSIDIVQGLELGADDYITKPFEINELLARVKAVLRRIKDEDILLENEIVVGDLTVNFLRHEVFVKREEVKLTFTEFKLLGELVKNKGCVLTHEVLLTKVWGHEYRDETHYLRVCVAKLRQKLGLTEGIPGWIHTIPTVGYKLLE
ncbi:response regulator transcription factor [Desulfitibacter alkalitolerans]|uniref:response regulator transcription factor n=1 Tax=Desulfitibacter alkalitolerans TaxID=264641 RepID=UPI00048A37F2|nr:response regulator transcription factor [Desulfitibacter alkalitolerans]